MAPVWLPKQCKLGSQASRNFVFEKCCDEKMFGKILYLPSIKSSAYTIPDLIKVGELSRQLVQYAHTGNLKMMIFVSCTLGHGHFPCV